MAIGIVAYWRMEDRTFANAASVSSDHKPRSVGEILPIGSTAVASMINKPAPERARPPRWIRCQSVGLPSTAEYWHIGAMIIRFFKFSFPNEIGEKSALIVDFPVMLKSARERGEIANHHKVN